MSFKSAKPENKLATPANEKVTTMKRFGWILKDGVVLSCIGLAFFLFIVLFSYSPTDSGFDSAGEVQDIQNYGGKTGAWLSSMLLYVFGVFGFLIPFGILLAGWVTLKIRTGNELDYLRFILSLLGLLLLISAGAGLANLYMQPNALIQLPYSAGGVLGYELSSGLVHSIDLLGATLVLLILFALAFSMFSSCSWLTIIEFTGESAIKLTEKVKSLFQDKVMESEKVKDKVSKIQSQVKQSVAKIPVTGDDAAEARKQWLAKILPAKESKNQTTDQTTDKNAEDIQSKNSTQSISGEPTIDLNKMEPVDSTEYTATSQEIHSTAEPLTQTKETKGLTVGTKEVPKVSSPIVEKAQLPRLDLLDTAPSYDEGFSKDELTALSGLLEQRLLEFGVTVQVESVQPGPVVTRFEILPAPGVKVSQINNLAKD